MPTPESLNPLAALHVLTAYLEARARAGQERIWMSPAARTALKEICRMKPGRMVFPKPQPAAPTTPGKTETEATRVTEETPAAAAPAPAAEPAPLSSTSHSPSSLSRRERLAGVASRALAAPKARVLGTLREKMVFATGNPDAEIMLVGEAPGAREEELGEPFVGPAGQLLDRILKAMGLERSDVYISNICKFRPKTGDGRQGTGNRKPTPDEMQSCIEFIQEEIAIIQPRVIIALGGTAAEGLLQKPVAVTRARGQWLDYKGIPLMITFHPSYLLHRGGEDSEQSEKRKLWEDMLMVMERLGMTVSEKQRRYFLPK